MAQGDLRMFGLDEAEDSGRESDAARASSAREQQEQGSVDDQLPPNVRQALQEHHEEKSRRRSGIEGPYADYVDTRELGEGSEEPAEQVQESSEQVQESQSRIERVKQRLAEHRQQGTEESDEAAELRSELDRERQAKARLEGELGQRIKSLEEQLRGEGSQDGDLPDPRNIVDFASPAVKAALEAAFEDGDMAEYNRIYSTLLMEGAEKIVDSRLKELESERESEREERELSQQQQMVVDNVEQGIDRAAKMGGTELEVVQDFAQNGDQSLLWGMLQRHQSLANTPEGVVEAVMLTARVVERADVGDDSTESTGQQPDAPARRAADTASPRTGANRSVREEVQRRKRQEDEEVDPAQEIKDSILSAGDPTHRLPKVFRS